MQKMTRVLIVDDEAGSRQGLSELVRSWGYQTDTAADGAEGLEKSDTFRPQVVIADLVMPGLSGAELFREIQARNRQVPVVIITAHADLEQAVTLMREGAADFVQKPLEEATFVPRVERCLRELRLQEEVRQLRAVTTSTPRGASQPLATRPMRGSSSTTRTRNPV